MKKFIVQGRGVYFTPQIEVEAETLEDAIEIAGSEFPPTLCHYCADKVEFSDEVEFVVFDKDGEEIKG